MYGSYGSYSSMCAVQMSAPMDIGAGHFCTRQESTCAFPSWPRRSSLSESECEERASSYLSDEDLFPMETAIEDDARSISSSDSAASPMATSPQQLMTEADLEELQRQRQAYQREVLRFLAQEKERRRQAAKRQRRGSSGSKKSSPKSKLSSMTPIAEAGLE